MMKTTEIWLANKIFNLLVNNKPIKLQMKLKLKLT